MINWKELLCITASLDLFINTCKLNTINKNCYKVALDIYSK